MIEDLNLPTEEDMKGSRLTTPGWYHLAIVAECRNDDNTATQVTFETLSGTAAGMEGRQLVHFFQDPNPSHKDGGKFAAQLKTKLYLATGMISPQNLGQKVRIDSAHLVGKQLVAKVSLKKSNTGKEYAEIEGGEMYSPLDPVVNHVPKNQQALAMLPKPAGAPPANVAPAAPPAATAPVAPVAPPVAPVGTAGGAPAPANDPWAGM